MKRGVDGVSKPICLSVPLPVMNSSTMEVRKPIMARRPTQICTARSHLSGRMTGEQFGNISRVKLLKCVWCALLYFIICVFPNVHVFTQDFENVTRQEIRCVVEAHLWKGLESEEALICWQPNAVGNLRKNKIYFTLRCPKGGGLRRGSWHAGRPRRVTLKVTMHHIGKMGTSKTQ